MGQCEVTGSRHPRTPPTRRHMHFLWPLQSEAHLLHNHQGLEVPEFSATEFQVTGENETVTITGEWLGLSLLWERTEFTKVVRRILNSGTFPAQPEAESKGQKA